MFLKKDPALVASEPSGPFALGEHWLYQWYKTKYIGPKNNVEKDMGADTASGHGHVFVALGSSKYPARFTCIRCVAHIFDGSFGTYLFFLTLTFIWLFLFLNVEFFGRSIDWFDLIDLIDLIDFDWFDLIWYNLIDLILPLIWTIARYRGPNLSKRRRGLGTVGVQRPVPPPHERRHTASTIATLHFRVAAERGRSVSIVQRQWNHVRGLEFHDQFAGSQYVDQCSLCVQRGQQWSNPSFQHHSTPPDRGQCGNVQSVQFVVQPSFDCHHAPPTKIRGTQCVDFENEIGV